MLRLCQGEEAGKWVDAGDESHFSKVGGLNGCSRNHFERLGVCLKAYPDTQREFSLRNASLSETYEVVPLMRLRASLAGQPRAAVPT